MEAIDEDTGVSFFVARATVAFAVFEPERAMWFHGYRDVERDVLRFMFQGKKTYIGQLESLAYSCVTESLDPEIFRGSASGVRFIDNTSAKFGLQKGYSRRPDTGRIINAMRASSARHSFYFVLGSSMCLLGRIWLTSLRGTGWTSTLPPFLRRRVWWRASGPTSSFRILVPGKLLWRLCRCLRRATLGGSVSVNFM